MATIKFIKYLLDIIPNIINKVKYDKNELSILIDKKNLKFFSIFLNKHINTQFKNIISIICVDYPKQEKRFEINYNFLSLKYNSRIKIKLLISELDSVNSLVDIFKGANWYERETWDTYGVYFVNHPDLRRILTDYGFEGFPFRKDFPQTGFNELRYDDKKKNILYESLEITQEYRFFDYNTNWLQVK